MSKRKSGDKSDKKSKDENSEKGRIILPEKLVTLEEHFGEEGYDGQDLLELISGPTRSLSEVFNVVATTIQNLRFEMSEDEILLAVANGVKDSEISNFRKSVPFKTLTLEESAGGALEEHLDFMTGASVINSAQKRELQGMIYESFSRQARGKEVILLGHLEKMKDSDPAQKFLDGAFFNPNVVSINGHDKSDVAKHVSLLREGKKPTQAARIFEFRPR